ncbi:hypothetical protein Ddye_024747 [Dipteronia dyeriana]|uniref:GDSL esterase/lipase n=1 Tax=Dipteronia dyeriana TaxID=168575 RepID=A0AAD9TVF6_9ROSI|nr:hypothetical protein Ddye_024747 [Dipteronia dyeriana]
MRSWTSYFLMFSLFVDLFLGSNGDVFRVPPLNVNQKDLLKLLELGDDIKFDVPALYVFGDSTVDSGNNNFLQSSSKANFKPFGVDFANGKPTGRFSNGRIEADFIAQVVGLPFPPPCLGLSKAEQNTLRTGVNYASSSCGVLPDTGKFLRLYGMGARKFLVNSVGMMGCSPMVFNSEHKATCDDEYNERARIVNKLLSDLWPKLQSELFGSKFIFADAYKVLADIFASPKSYGFTNTRDSCCAAAENGTRPCIHNIAPCNNRNEHVFFDPFHGSETTHFILAKHVFRVPPLNVNQKDLLKLLELGDDIKFDVPALYVFGDSTVDSGNNNFLQSSSKANFKPFGVDFANGKPTGRFSNGRIEADFIAQVVGLPFPPPCLGLSKAEQNTLRTGVNYASSSCGVLPDTGKFLRLYGMGARKFLVNSVGMMGCSPMVFNSEHKATCDDEYNERARIVNKLLSDLWPKLQSELFGSKFIFADAYKVLADIFASPKSYGFTNTRDSCCAAAENGTRPCIHNIAPCNNRNEHVFFDPFHGSETTHFILAKRCLKESSICRPINLVDFLRA